ncbi:MAG: hypothetical protein KGL39_51035 [Patescibacteria group bacterium]|nr:hypothetical protein [Patescibacteria group bacterium]
MRLLATYEDWPELVHQRLLEEVSADVEPIWLGLYRAAMSGLTERQLRCLLEMKRQHRENGTTHRKTRLLDFG